MNWPRLLILIVTGFVIWWTFAPPPAPWVEYVYSRAFYRWLASAVVPLSDLSPVSLSALLIPGFVLALSLLLWRSWRRRQTASRWLLLRLGRGLSFMILLYALFIVSWGANYRRLPLGDVLELKASPVELNDVIELTRQLSEIITENAPKGQSRNAQTALASLRKSLDDVLTELKTPVTLPTRIKKLPAGILLAVGSSGVISPILLEAHIDAALPEAVFLAIATHELAHIAGFAGEADAELLAAIAGLKTSDPYARYTVALQLFTQLVGQLPADVQASFLKALPTEARQDLELSRKALARYQQPTLTTLSRNIYDRYLRTQGVSAGIADYSRITKLLVQAKRQGLVLNLD